MKQSKIDEVVNSLSFHPGKPEQLDKYEALRASAIAFAKDINMLTPSSREQSLAYTHLEDALMWAIKSIAVNE